MDNGLEKSSSMACSDPLRVFLSVMLESNLSQVSVPRVSVQHAKVE